MISSPVVIRPAITWLPPYQSRPALASGIRSCHATSTMRLHHHVSISCRASRSSEVPWRIPSNFGRAKPRTTRMPLNASVAVESTSPTCARTSRKSGRSLPIHVRCVSVTAGKRRSAPSRRRQSVNARIVRIPSSWITARHGL